MRRIIFTAMTALAALPAVAGVPSAGGTAAASPVSTHPLAPEEVLVELSAMGTGTTRADTATVNMSFNASGAGEEAARRSHDELVERFRAAARGAGVAAADINVSEPLNMSAFSMDMPPEPEPGSTETAPPAPEPEITLQGGMTLTLRDTGRVEAVEQALREVDGSATVQTEYSVTDDRPGRRAARQAAIAAARADAEAYAEALNMRVTRIVRVTERGGMDLMTMMMTDPSLAQQLEQGAPAAGPDVPVRVFVGVDFALAPR